ncbi:MAG: FxsA family protein [Acidimicrobiales bacterium]
MFVVLAVVFLLVPIVEIYVMLQVAHTIGVPETILLLIAVSVAGAWLAKMAGLGVLNRLQRTVRAGKVPSAELVDGALVLFAAALMLAPGFITDCLAIVLLIPPSRALVRGVVLRRIRTRGGLFQVITSVPTGSRGASGSEVWDVESWEDPPERPSLEP